MEIWGQKASLVFLIQNKNKKNSRSLSTIGVMEWIFIRIIIKAAKSTFLIGYWQKYDDKKNYIFNYIKNIEYFGELRVPFPQKLLPLNSNSDNKSITGSIYFGFGKIHPYRIQIQEQIYKFGNLQSQYII